MQDLEALVSNLLLSVSLNIILEELVSGLVSLDWVAQIILIDGLVLSQKGANCLDTRGTLQVLTIDLLLNVSVKILDRDCILDLDLFKDSHDHSPEAFQVPVLIDDLMDHSCLEDLVDLLRK